MARQLPKGLKNASKVASLLLLSGCITVSKPTFNFEGDTSHFNIEASPAKNFSDQTVAFSDVETSSTLKLDQTRGTKSNFFSSALGWILKLFGV
jgi:hypothetical protein